MRYFLILIVVFLARPALADMCAAELLPEGNGLYYSVTGREADARKLDLVQFRNIDAEKLTALEGPVAQPYSANGRFFLRSGHAGEPWVVVPGSARREALLLRRLTQSVKPLTSEFISVYRRTLTDIVCPEVGDQPGYDAERNYVPNAEFILFHLNPVVRLNNPTLDRVFHFRQQRDGGACYHTADIVDDRGENIAGMAYVGREDINIATNGELILERSAQQLAQILLPSPAYASAAEPGTRRDPRRQITVSSAEVSLHNLESPGNVCVSFPAPTPTVRAARGWFARLFDLVPAHQRAAFNLAASGEWVPTVTEIHVQQIANARQSALLRLIWPATR